MQQELSDSPDRSTGLKTLAIEVIGREGSIALMDDARVVEARWLGRESRAAAGLAVQISDLAEKRLPDRLLSSLDGISVAVGPGSFTGLRVAVTTAKTLGYALQIPIVAVNSLCAIAELSPVENAKRAVAASAVLVGLSAYRGQVYRGRFVAGEDADIDLVSAEQWKTELQSAVSCGTAQPMACDETPHSHDEKKYIFMGDRAVFDRVGVEISDAQWAGDGLQRAAGVGRLGVEMLRRGETTPAMDLVPDYLRPSAAEEKASGAIG
ncbi:Peptidase M22, glycoprotease domain protein [Rhodopirellula sallentina SM41]|uniref:Peptidase M22, glycoprotease domain protein n=2 Tax=Rhodopirellula TaxID=265488 RepID=M5U1T4_9BACT|nr:Peptidase M22, glycoprotease domain protein [Rhodopirellula sallentina SM41]